MPAINANAAAAKRYLTHDAIRVDGSGGRQISAQEFKTAVQLATGGDDYNAKPMTKEGAQTINATMNERILFGMGTTAGGAQEYTKFFAKYAKKFDLVPTWE